MKCIAAAVHPAGKFFVAIVFKKENKKWKMKKKCLGKN